MSDSRPLELPLAEDAPRPERADAARNRLALIAAASALLEESGVEAITMDAVACRAGVGKGTLFRRFGDRPSLFRALLDESERAFQEAFIRGPAPLGPGAAPAERLYAFGCALLERIEQHGELLIAAQQDPIMRLSHPTYTAYRLHVVSLLREAGADDAADYLANALLAALDPGLVLFQRRALGMPVQELHRGWRALVGSVVAACR